MFPGAHNPEMDTANEKENRGATNMPFLNQKEKGVEQNKTEPLSPEHKHHIQSIVTGAGLQSPGTLFLHICTLSLSSAGMQPGMLFEPCPAVFRVHVF